MLIKLKYFARFRELLACAEEELEIQNHLQVKDVIAVLSQRGGQWKKIFSDTQHLLSAVNQEISHMGFVLKEGDELAFYPPVTGG